MHPSIYNIQPKRLSELIDEVLAEIEANGGMPEAIRQEKCSLIDDIFRVKKLSIVLNPAHLVDINEKWWDTFNMYYDMTLPELEVELASLSMYLSRYMKQQTLAHNNGWLHIDFRTTEE